MNNVKNKMKITKAIVVVEFIFLLNLTQYRSPSNPLLPFCLSTIF